MEDGRRVNKLLVQIYDMLPLDLIYDDTLYRCLNLEWANVFRPLKSTSIPSALVKYVDKYYFISSNKRTISYSGSIQRLP